MQVNLNNLNNYNNVNFNATLKIYRVGNQHSQISEDSIKLVEKAFSFATKDEDGQLDVILYDRYNAQNASKDKILFIDGTYTDSTDTYIKDCKDSNTMINKFVSILHNFKKVKILKEEIINAFDK